MSHIRPKKESFLRATIKKYLLEHPDASNSQVGTALGASRRTIEYARADLVDDGLAPEAWLVNRKFVPKAYLAESATLKKLPAGSLPNFSPVYTKAVGGNPAAKTAEQLIAPFTPLASEDLYRLLAAGDDVEIDDEKTRVAMLKQLRLMSFDASLHQSIRMSAMDLYNKLKESARGQTIGPGKPLTHAAALDRLMLLFKAIGPELVIEAMDLTFATGKEGSPNGERGIAVENEDTPAPSLSTS